jgi:hypothetical protein
VAHNQRVSKTCMKAPVKAKCSVRLAKYHKRRISNGNGTSDLGNAGMIACSGTSRMPRLVTLSQSPQFAKPNASRAQERARGAVAFHVETGKPARRIEQFNPQAEQIILVPRVVGG